MTIMIFIREYLIIFIMIYIEILAVQFEHDMNSIPSQIQPGAGR